MYSGQAIVRYMMRRVKSGSMPFCASRSSMGSYDGRSKELAGYSEPDGSFAAVRNGQTARKRQSHPVSVTPNRLSNISSSAPSTWANDIGAFRTQGYMQNASKQGTDKASSVPRTRVGLAPFGSILLGLGETLRPVPLSSLCSSGRISCLRSCP
jgi:hypothetical protein